MDSQECYVCHEFKPLSEFSRVMKPSGWYYVRHCKRCFADRAVQRHADRRLQVLVHYGAFCRCCGETELVFLTLDHVNEDGHLHRRELGGKRRGPAPVYRDIIRRGYPDGFQVLCFNCNYAKSRGGCPHQRVALDSLLQGGDAHESPRITY